MISGWSDAPSSDQLGLFLDDPSAHAPPWLDRVLDAVSGHADGMSQSDKTLGALDGESLADLPLEAFRPDADRLGVAVDRPDCRFDIVHRNKIEHAVGQFRCKIDWFIDLRDDNRPFAPTTENPIEIVAGQLQPLDLVSQARIKAHRWAGEMPRKRLDRIEGHLAQSIEPLDPGAVGPALHPDHAGVDAAFLVQAAPVDRERGRDFPQNGI